MLDVRFGGLMVGVYRLVKVSWFGGRVQQQCLGELDRKSVV